MAQHAAIFTALSLPGVSVQPSTKCLQWTADGQLVILTKYAVYLLTPDLALGADWSTITRRSTEVETFGTNMRPLRWVRTMIEYDRILVHQWQSDSLEWRAVSLGSLDPVLRSVAPSPIGLGSTAGCVLALLNSNMEVTIWGPVKNHLQGEWTKLLDVTAALRKRAASDSDTSGLQRVLQAQSTSIAWSAQADFDISPASPVDASLLVTSSRSGALVFLRLVPENGSAYTAQHAATAKVSDAWITQLAWSRWRTMGLGACESLLACANSDGEVRIVAVKQTLQRVSWTSSRKVEDIVTMAVEVRGAEICFADGRSITGLQWIDPGSRNQPILAYCKPGMLFLWSDAHANPGVQWSGIRALRLRTQKMHVGSSSLRPVSGISYCARTDALIMTLSDGSFHVVHEVSTNPTWNVSPQDPYLNSEDLTRAGRVAFAKVQSKPMLSRDVNQTSGVVPFDKFGTYAWIHEASRPTDFSYKHDAKHVSMLVTAQLWDHFSNESLADELRQRLEHSRAGIESPSSMLRSVMMRLRDPQQLARMADKIIEILLTSSAAGQAVDIQIAPLDTEMNSQLRDSFRNSLSAHLFGWDAIMRQRLRLVLAGFLQKEASDIDGREVYEQVVRSSTSAIAQHILRLILRHGEAVTRLLTAPDTVFISRVAAVAQLHGSTTELLQDADELVARCNAVPSDQILRPGFPSELCPACHALVELQDISVAHCPNGHVWARCCITSYILSTPMVRTCVVCGRKALLPASKALETPEQLPETVRTSWLAQDLLDAVHRCPICAGNFVSFV